MIEEQSAKDVKLQARVGYILLGIACIVLVFQLASLFVFPQPNSMRWFGDETWLMSEAKSQITTGVVRYPLARGSTLENSKGLVLSMTWLSSLLYGLPAILAHADEVLVGRVVTSCLSVLLCIALYLSGLRLGASKLAASIGVLLMISTRAFFFASHSCRTDILAGFITLLFVAFNIREIGIERMRSARWFLIYGCVLAFLCVSSSIHLLTLLAPVSLYFIWKLGKGSASAYLYAFIGGLVILAILFGVYYLTTGNAQLFAQTSTKGQFHDVLSSIPILRPFSRSVQLSNLFIRFRQLKDEAPQLVLFVVAVSVAAYFHRSRSISPLVISIGIVFLSWLLLEGAEINYLVHILPLLFLGLTLTLSHTNGVVRRPILFVSVVAAVVFGAFGLRDAVFANRMGTTLDQSNKLATARLLDRIETDHRIASRPTVLTETLALDRLTNSPTIHVITDHFISFPTNDSGLSAFLRKESVDYIVLYNTPVFPKNRYTQDPFYQGVRETCIALDSSIGTTGDMGRDYFQPSDFLDTLFLFKVSASGK